MMAPLLLHTNWLQEKFEKLPKVNEVLDCGQYLAFVDKTFWQNRTQYIIDLALTELMSDKDVEEWNDPLPNLYVITL